MVGLIFCQPGSLIARRSTLFRVAMRKQPSLQGTGARTCGASSTLWGLSPTRIPSACREDGKSWDSLKSLPAFDFCFSQARLPNSFRWRVVSFPLDLRFPKSAGSVGCLLTPAEVLVLALARFSRSWCATESTLCWTEVKHDSDLT